MLTAGTVSAVKLVEKYNKIRLLNSNVGEFLRLKNFDFDAMQCFKGKNHL